MLSLKRGHGYSTYHKVWESPRAEWSRSPDSSPDDSPGLSWDYLPVFVPSGKETFVGVKIFNGKRFSVFKCLDDSFMAQPEETTSLPNPADPMKVLCLLPNIGDAESQVEFLEFHGTNWKLSGDKKWKNRTAAVNLSDMELCGSRSWDGKERKVYGSPGYFIAI